jgi:GTPase SAR1 family protein
MTHHRMDIWDSFGREAKSKKQPEVTCFFIGSQSAGKSTLIGRFLDQTGSSTNQKATIGLEYIYAKKGNILCNIWEAGGNCDSNILKMIQVPLKSVVNSKKVFILVLDLNSLNILDSICSNFIKFYENYQSQQTGSGGGRKPEVIILANKYDKFSSRENELKKCVNTYIRVIAKLLNAQLIQISNKSESSMIKYKKILSKIIFKTQTTITNEIDINKNLVIIEDSWESIGIKKKDIAKSNLDKFITQERIGSSRKRDESSDESFKEAKIDSAVLEFSNFTKYKNIMKKNNDVIQ